MRWGAAMKSRRDFSSRYERSVHDDLRARFDSCVPPTGGLRIGLMRVIGIIAVIRR